MKLKIDAADWAVWGSYRWQVLGLGYIARAVPNKKCTHCNRVTYNYEYLHRLLLGSPPGLQVDHINGDRTDNRRENLRAVTATHNMHNRNKWSSTREFRGVSKVGEVYRAAINFEGSRFDLGTFPSAREAAEAYDKAARERYGEYAKTNF